MKYFFLLSIFFIGVTHVHAQEFMYTSKTQWGFSSSDNQLKIYMADSIKSVNVYKLEIQREGKKIDSTLIGSKILGYLGNGAITVHVELLHGKQKMANNYTYQFDPAGNVIKRSSFSEDNKFSVLGNYYYDENNKLVLTEQYNKDTTYVDLYKNFYDNKGRLEKTMVKRQSQHYQDKDFWLSDSCLYSPDGQLSEKRHYFGNNYVSYLYEYSGTDSKTITVTEQNDATQHLISKDTYSKNGLLLSSMSSPFADPFRDDYKNEQTTWKYYYNIDGTANTSIRYFNGKADYMIKFYYTKR